MNWGNEKQKNMKIQNLLEQYTFLKKPGPIVPYLPDTIDVDISNRCNLKCISCFHSIDKFRPMGDMSFETLTNILEQAQGNSSSITIGNHGEPLLHKDVFTIIREVKKRGFFLNFITNGTLLKMKLAHQLLDVGVDRLVFSLDSVDPEHYRMIRRGARLEVTLRNILYFLKINHENKLNTYVNISMVDTDEALKSDINIFDYFANLPVHIVYTSPLLNFHDMLPIREETKYFKKFQTIADKKGFPVCINGFDRLLIRPNGNASLCGIDWDSIHILGNINEASYMELWNNDKAQEFRRGLLTSNYSAIERNGFLCSKCDVKWSCNVETGLDNIANLFATDIQDGKSNRNRELTKIEYYDHLLLEMDKLDNNK